MTAISPDPTRPSTAAWLRAAALLAGACAFGVLSVLIPYIGRTPNGGYGLIHLEKNWALVPKPLVLACLCGAALGGLGLLCALAADDRLRAALRWPLAWARAHPVPTGLIILSALAGSADFYQLFYDPYSDKYARHLTERLFMLRWDLQSYFLLASSLCLGLAIWTTCFSSPSPLRERVVASSSSPPGEGESPDKLLPTTAAPTRHRSFFLTRYPYLLAFLLPLLLGGLMNRVALQGIPHFADSLTYLIQGRMILAGQLSMPKPAHLDLWEHSLYFVTDRQHVDPVTGQMVYEGTRFFGKYPVGWPAILGAFDHFHLGFLANAFLAGLLALLTGLLARQVATRRVAAIAALAMGLSPWIWFNGANFASHVASACAVTAFLWLLLRTMRTSQPRFHWGATDKRSLRSLSVSSPPNGPQNTDKPSTACQWHPNPAWSALASGLALGAGVLIRPQDAALFALPCVAAVLYMIFRQPRRWIILGSLVAAGALLGASAYLWQNHATTGSSLLSAYTLEGRWGKRDWNPHALPMLARVFFQWAQLNSHFPGWGAGGLTVAILGSFVAYRRRRPAGLWLILASSLLFFLGCTAFGFTTVWWGPRWLLPVTPILAILTAEFIDLILKNLTPSPPSRALQGRLSSRNSNPASNPAPAARLALSILIAGLMVGLVFAFGGQWRLHTIIPPHGVSAAVARKADAMSLQNAVVAMDPQGPPYAPFDPRAGIAFMSVPFAENRVIYVRAVPSWEQMAKDSFPGRLLYLVEPDDNSLDGFNIQRLP